jgi:hypothetical protein
MHGIQMFLYGLLSNIYSLWIGEVHTSSLNLNVANINIKSNTTLLKRIPTNFFLKDPYQDQSIAYVQKSIPIQH